MTAKELKEKLSPSLVESIMNIVKDPTIVSKIDQIQGLLFLELTDEYWDELEDNAEVL